MVPTLEAAPPHGPPLDSLPHLAEWAQATSAALPAPPDADRRFPDANTTWE